jgi:hypothetical protein
VLFLSDVEICINNHNCCIFSCIRKPQAHSVNFGCNEEALQNAMFSDRRVNKADGDGKLDKKYIDDMDIINLLEK